jgi:hypothetical protein
LDIPIRKYIPRFRIIIEYLLIENKLLYHEIKIYKDILGIRKIRKIRKRMKLEDIMILSLKEYIEMIWDYEIITKIKKKSINKSMDKL